MPSRPEKNSVLVLKKSQGFSLLELMTALLILAVVTSAVALSIGSSSSEQKRLDELGEKLYVQMQFAQDEALIKHQIVGLRIDQDNTEYSWFGYQGTGWEKFDSLLSTVSWPDNVRFEVIIDDELLEDLLEESLNAEREEEAPPSIIFYPNSEISAFEITLMFVGNDEDRFQIYIDDNGDLSNSKIDAQVEAENS